MKRIRDLSDDKKERITNTLTKERERPNDCALIVSEVFCSSLGMKKKVISSQTQPKIEGISLANTKSLMSLAESVSQRDFDCSRPSTPVVFVTLPPNTHTQIFHRFCSKCLRVLHLFA